jgi:peptide deformylase
MGKPIDHARRIAARHGAPSHSPSGTFVSARVMRVVTHPDPVLKARAAIVDPCDPAIVALSRALTVTMRASPACVGLAATQVGEPVHIFCMDVTGHRKARSCAGLVVLVNARVVAWSEEILMREGCMSVPHHTGNVLRAAEVIVEGFEPGTSRLVRVSADGIEARCLQHEIDHLEGFVFVDRVRDHATDLFPRKAYV